MTKIPNIYIPILVLNGIVVRYDEKYTHKTFNGCKNLCNDRNTYNKDVLGAVWIVAKYGDPQIVLT